MRRLALIAMFATACATTPKAAPTSPALGHPGGNIVPATMRRYFAKFAGCYQRYHRGGLVKLSIAVAPDGQVTAAETLGDLAGTDEGGCIADVAHTMVFPAFPRAWGFTYPIMLR